LRKSPLLGGQGARHEGARRPRERQGSRRAPRTETALERFETLGAAADAAAGAIAAAVAAGVEARGAASLVLTGGRTPGPIYDRLARTALPWGRVRVTLSDERCVEPTSSASNERLLRERLLVGPAAAARLVRLDDLQQMPRPFDLVLLGMGEDGHVASLFPGSPALAEGLSGAGPVVAVPAGRPAPAEDRLSLTLPTLLDAREVLIFVTGEAKRAVLDRASGLPVGAVLQGPAPVRVIWSP
jgi:6-phosphogluconolactonase